MQKGLAGSWLAHGTGVTSICLMEGLPFLRCHEEKGGRHDANYGIEEEADGAAKTPWFLACCCCWGSCHFYWALVAVDRHTLAHSLLI